MVVLDDHWLSKASSPADSRCPLSPESRSRWSARRPESRSPRSPAPAAWTSTRQSAAHLLSERSDVIPVADPYRSYTNHFPLGVVRILSSFSHPLRGRREAGLMGAH